MVVRDQYQPQAGSTTGVVGASTATSLTEAVSATTGIASVATGTVTVIGTELTTTTSLAETVPASVVTATAVSASAAIPASAVTTSPSALPTTTPLAFTTALTLEQRLAAAEKRANEAEETLARVKARNSNVDKIRELKDRISLTMNKLAIYNTELTTAQRTATEHGGVNHVVRSIRKGHNASIHSAKIDVERLRQLIAPLEAELQSCIFDTQIIEDSSYDGSRPQVVVTKENLLDRIEALLANASAPVLEPERPYL